MPATQKITPCLWFDTQAEEAANFYATVFDGSTIGRTTRYGEAGREIHGQPAGSVSSVEFQLAGHRFIALNGGPKFKFTPAISFYVTCETENEVDSLWSKLSEEGQPLMELGAYDWSPKYGWIQDRYGLTWQISVGNLADVGQRIVPCLLFAGEQHGKADEAINFYTGTFQDSKIDSILRYQPGDHEPEGTVKHAQFSLAGQKLMAIASSLAHGFSFNEAISLEVECGAQEEVDYFWQKLVEKGGTSGRCGWLKDRFGVSWQVVPTVVGELLADADSEKTERVMSALLAMDKLDVTKLKRASAGQ